MPLQHALLGLDCPSARVQGLSLLLVLCHLRGEAPRQTAVAATATAISTATTSKPTKSLKKKTTAPKQKDKGKLRDKAKKVRNALKLQDATKKKQRSAHVLACEKLLESGHVRKIYWCLLNDSCSARQLAVEVSWTAHVIPAVCLLLWWGARQTVNCFAWRLLFGHRY